MGNTQGKNERSPLGRRPENTSRASTVELVDFISEQAKRRATKEIARITGLSIKAVEAMRLGESGASSQTITTWCRNDPHFRAEYFAFCGGYVESDPEFITGITMALNSLARRKQGE